MMKKLSKSRLYIILMNFFQIQIHFSQINISILLQKYFLKLFSINYLRSYNNYHNFYVFQVFHSLLIISKIFDVYHFMLMNKRLSTTA